MKHMHGKRFHWRNFSSFAHVTHGKYFSSNRGTIGRGEDSSGQGCRKMWRWCGTSRETGDLGVIAPTTVIWQQFRIGRVLENLRILPTIAGIVIASLAVVGCQQVTEADVRAAKRMAEEYQPKNPPCGGRFLTEVELKKLVVGSLIKNDAYKSTYRTDGIKETQFSNQYVAASKVKYVVVGSALCVINFGKNMQFNCQYFARYKNKIYRVQTVKGDFTADQELPRQYECESSLPFGAN